MPVPSEQLSAKQRQRMEENKRKAKERLTAKLSVLKKMTKAGQVSHTPSHQKDDVLNVERDSKQPAIPVKSKLQGNTHANTNKISCPVCLGDIIDGRHEAIFCEGKRKWWYHRGCASVSQELLSALTASGEPFYCLMCSRDIFKQQVNELVAEVNYLKAELKDIPIIQASIETLKGEIAELRNCALVTSLHKVPMPMQSP